MATLSHALVTIDSYQLFVKMAVVRLLLRPSSPPFLMINFAKREKVGHLITFHPPPHRQNFIKK
jgi:hypothetical protein